MRTLDQISLSPAERSAVQEAAGLLRREFAVQRITLFGSKARGQGDAESDIDLLILVEGPVDYELEHRIQQTLYPLEMKWNVFFGLLIVAREDWETGRWQVLPIRTEVERDGVAA